MRPTEDILRDLDDVEATRRSLNTLEERLRLELKGQTLRVVEPSMYARTVDTRKGGIRLDEDSSSRTDSVITPWVIPV